MTVICWPGRRDTILSYFCEGCEGAGDEKTFHTSLLLCDQKQPDLSLAMSINLGKVCEHFIMNQTMIFKILLFPIANASRAQRPHFDIHLCIQLNIVSNTVKTIGKHPPIILMVQ